MRTRVLGLSEWVHEEGSLLRYLMSPHEGHRYTEDILDGICLIISWLLVTVSILAVLGIIIAAVL